MDEVPPLKERRLEVLPREIDAMESPPRFVLVVHRRFECSRLEKDFLAAAYQQVISEIRRPLFEEFHSQMAPSVSFDHDIFPSRKVEGAP